ncbi:sulfurtransferase [Haematomicrobium sanguinis]|uniref:sulfurtransferase n=1 Tax=Haematomicrobium sanguinis TaxID=479106 RepID=UPI00047B7540|nr:sulfurtransferase [Haematomicrobium sanguinis]
MKNLIDVRELRNRMTSGEHTVILDVRWQLGGPNGHEEYRKGHIPSAVYVDLDAELAAPPVAAEGRHPLPEASLLEDAAQRWGIHPGDTVVVYDDWSSMAAARAWWLLRDGGLDDVRVLDGGLGAWKGQGYEVDTGEETHSLGSVTLSPGNMPRLALEDVLEFAADNILLDARAPERYRGESEPVDPVAGHIPGALNAPTSANVDEDGRFLDRGALADRFAFLGEHPGAELAVYCGSGVSAAHEIFALDLIGKRAALYPGSWSQWSNHPELPVATGA